MTEPIADVATNVPNVTLALAVVDGEPTPEVIAKVPSVTDTDVAHQ